MTVVSRVHHPSLVPAVDNPRPVPTILIADDVPDVLDLLIDCLRPMPAEIMVAGDGAEAVARYREKKPDLVLLDVNMPRMTGLEVCAWIKAQTRETLDFVPVIMLSTNRERRVATLDAGADDYVLKPFSPAEIVARARAMLRIKALQDDVLVARAGLVRANAELVRRVEFGVKEHERVNRLRRYLSPALVQSVLETDRDDFMERMTPRRKDVSIVFSEIRNFVQIADQLEPEEVRTILDSYLREMSEAVFTFGGTIDKFLGDGIMVLFNDPVEQPDHVERAIRTALAMLDRARILEAKLHTVLPEPFAIGVGVHTGTATVGNLGSGRLVEYTAIGSAVNLASRIQGLASPNEIIASAAVYDPLAGRVLLENERRETMKGFAHPVRVAQVVGFR